LPFGQALVTSPRFTPGFSRRSLTLVGAVWRASWTYGITCHYRKKFMFHEH